MNILLKAVLVGVYALALVSLAGWLPADTFARTRWVAAALLAIHAIELPLFPGPLAVSVVLTLLFGLLHWKPLADRHARPAP